jgi:hypothetical protein
MKLLAVNYFQNQKTAVLHVDVSCTLIVDLYIEMSIYSKVISIFGINSSIELSSSWEVNSCSVTQGIPSILQNPKVHCHVHMSPLLVLILSQMNPFHTHPLFSYRIISFHLRLDRPSGLFPIGLPAEILYEYLFSPMCVLWPARLILLDVILIQNVHWMRIRVLLRRSDATFLRDYRVLPR